MRVEFDDVGGQHDGRGMISVFGQRIFHRLRAADEQSTEQAVAFLGDPVSPAVLSDQDLVRMARRGFIDLFHCNTPAFCSRCRRSGDTSEAPDIEQRTYEFESEARAIS